MVNTNIKGLIAYTMEKLEKHNIYRRTFVQKILYFSLPEDVRKELFIPYLYGPYSAGIQRIIQYLESNPKYIKRWKNETNAQQITKKIDRLISFIIKNRIKTDHFSQLAKLHYILNMLHADEYKITDFQTFGIKLGWTEFCKINEEKLKKLIDELTVLSKN